MSAAPIEVIVETPASAPVAATPAAPPPSPSEAAGVAPLKGFVKPDAAPPAPAEPVKAPAWVDGLSADERAYVASKGWDKEGKGPADILKSYRNIERLRGVDAEQLIRKPDFSKPESVAEFYAALGVPAEPTAYEAPPTPIPGGTLDNGIIAAVSHELNLTQPQHAGLMTKLGQILTAEFAAHQEDVARQDAVGLADLKKEWGSKWDEHMQSVDSAIARAQVSPDEVSALNRGMGEANARRFLARLGHMLGREHVPPGNTSGPDLMTPAVAVAKMNLLKADKAWMQAHADGDVSKRREWSELQRIAYGS